MEFQLHRFSELVTVPSQQIRNRFGGKALGLYEAHQLGLPIPSTWLIETSAHQAFLKMDPNTNQEEFIENHFQLSFEALPEGPFAVRSSSQTEDASKQSFAGIFETVLHVAKKDLAKAIAIVWGSTQKSRSVSYQAGKKKHFMGVLIQPMIKAKLAGVCFSKHPSPASIFENDQIVVEFAPASGEAVVQGEVTPYRLSSNAEVLSSAAEMEWLDELLKSVLELKKAYHKEVDIEFCVDANDGFWLLQQRPISKVVPSFSIDLSNYKRMYKRSLASLDVELLIEGCSLFLAPYLEIPFNLERWMLMTTGKDEIQELWVEELLNDSILAEMRSKIEKDQEYLFRLKVRYADYFQRLTQQDLASFFHSKTALHKRLFRWFEYITPFAAHYYVPMFMIDALYALLLREFSRVDEDRAESDLFEMARSGIKSLPDLLGQELRALPLHLDKCKELAEKYGFIKCRRPFEEPYTALELLKMAKTLPPLSEHHQIDLEALKDRYIQDTRTENWFTELRSWMQIRNQEMEYLLYAFLKARPLQEEVCEKLGITLEKFWNTPKELLLTALLNPKKASALYRFEGTHLTLVRANGKTHISPNFQVRSSTQDRLTDVKGRTVYGKGQVEAFVKFAFSPEELKETPTVPTVLVTGMTTPDFVPHIREKYVALVTDEGGVLCHAAIIARELPIPCIVGTGLATQILKMGMHVRIDFDRGEVEILDDHPNKTNRL